MSVISTSHGNQQIVTIVFRFPQAIQDILYAFRYITYKLFVFHLLHSKKYWVIMYKKVCTLYKSSVFLHHEWEETPKKKKLSEEGKTVFVYIVKIHTK